jgi:hypothetical protein
MVVSSLEGVADSIPSEITGTDVGTDWTLHLKGRAPVPLRLSFHGDSLIMLSDPYESILRAKTTVQVRMAAVRTDDGGLTARLVATYDAASGQQLVVGTARATRAPE